MQNRRSPQGFTLVELLTVIVIILIIAGWVISAMGPAMQKTSRNRAQSEIQMIVTACENYKSENGDYPREPGITESASGGEAPIDPRKHGNPTADNYKKSSLALYKMLTGDANANNRLDGDEPKKGYVFESSMLAPKNSSGKVNPVGFLIDPFGNSYGYCTSGSKAEEDYRNAAAAKPGTARPTDVPGFNTTFDLWSTGGKVNAGSAVPSDADRNVWLKNW